MNTTWIFWLIITVIFGIAEAVTAALVSIWFVVGSIAALIASLLGASYVLQTILMFSVSFVCLLVFFALRKKLSRGKAGILKTNCEAVIGEIGLVIERIDNLHGYGRVKVNGQEWAAQATDESVIPEGTQVRIDQIKGVKAYVHKRKS